MTTSVDLATVTNAIAALSISGVTVKDIDEITDSMKVSPATLAPRPEDFVTDAVLERQEITGQWNALRYTLHYRYYHCQIAGGLGGLFASYSGMMTKLAAILLAFCSDATLSGAMDNGEPTISNIGPVMDPSGNQYMGFEISIRVMQFLEV